MPRTARRRGENRSSDTRPGWRILRAEIWRQYGALLDLEKRYDKETDEELARLLHRPRSPRR